MIIFGISGNFLMLMTLIQICMSILEIENEIPLYWAQYIIIIYIPNIIYAYIIEEAAADANPANGQHG